MRFLVSLFLLNLILSCEKYADNSIIGTWELVESKTGTGSEIIINKDFDYSLQFRENGTYKDFTNGKAFSGKFSINYNNILELIDPVTKDTTYFSYQLSRSSLILDEVNKVGNLACDEGCTQIFKKVNP